MTSVQRDNTFLRDYFWFFLYLMWVLITWDSNWKNCYRLRSIEFTFIVDLNCRINDYLIHIVLVLILFLIEIDIWYLTHDIIYTSYNLIRRVNKKLERRFTNLEKSFENFRRTHRLLRYLQFIAFRDIIKTLIIRFLKAFNFDWLIYIIFAQTFKSYQTCEYMIST